MQNSETVRSPSLARKCCVWWLALVSDRIDPRWALAWTLLHAAEDTTEDGAEGAALPSIDDEDERASISSWGSASAHGSDRADDDDDDDETTEQMHDALDLEQLSGRRIGGGLSVPDIHDHHDDIGDHDSVEATELGADIRDGLQHRRKGGP